ncbi:type II 3-dehydroquinate dehydratase [Guyparkeria halophila]|uniref:3-dehydroquinate dehydratase n=1 Tax=Guyparkeria halophila TaxID=47960 RepID=A0A6I6D0W3_9GAMM|nr:type II 3-dehydroquinate dehydratase [Guyparkeria halophila]QGT77915.1 type II 3-dehydroquinate dehydratase [Guyparkeria halophila]
MKRILVLNGPNLNRLGTREPERYGRLTLADIGQRLDRAADGQGAALEHFQSNHEGEAIDRLHRAADEGIDGVLINPGAWTHTSVALRDALLAIDRPFVEIHLSNIHARESFRQHSYFSDVAVGSIVGLGALGYELALTALIAHLDAPSA